MLLYVWLIFIALSNPMTSNWQGVAVVVNLACLVPMAWPIHPPQPPLQLRGVTLLPPQTGMRTKHPKGIKNALEA